MFIKSVIRTDAQKKQMRRLNYSGMFDAILLVVVINILAQIFDTFAVYFSALLGLLGLALANLGYLVQLKIVEQHPGPDASEDAAGQEDTTS